MSKSLAIDLFCSEPGDVDRRSFPLTAGLPFARGVLTPGEPLYPWIGQLWPIRREQARGKLRR